MGRKKGGANRRLFCWVFLLVFLGVATRALAVAPPSISIAGDDADAAAKPAGSEAKTPAKNDGSKDEKKDEKKEEKPVERPTITGWHSWRYNTFSSYDQLRINGEKEYGKGQKTLVSLNGLYYQEDNNKSWNVYLGESYYKFKTKKMDFKFGLLTETWGSGDKISWVDKLNSRRYLNGLANEYNRDKKEVPAFKTTYYINKKMNIDFHYLPFFQASELPNNYSRWATAFQKTLATAVFLGAGYQFEQDNTFKNQFHVAFNSSFKKYELRYHYFWFKERIPVVDQVRDGVFRQTYPIDHTIALDGNVTLAKDFLMRFEFAFTDSKTYSTFEKGKIGRKFQSNQYNFLLGTDKQFKNSVYGNVQLLGSYIPELPAKTPVQLNRFEMLMTCQVKQGFKSDTLFLEFNGVENLSTSEFILTPQVVYQKSDFLKLTAGIHINGKSTETLGPIGQFDMNNTPYFETLINF